jgi:hypothetical protein
MVTIKKREDTSFAEIDSSSSSERKDARFAEIDSLVTISSTVT